MAELLDLKVNATATVNYGDTFGTEGFKLLEVDEKILKELLQNGLTIKGSPNEEAVLCTSSTTYAIKYVSTSNTVLLIPPSQYPNSAVEISDKESDVTVHGKDVMGPANAGTVATAPGHMELVETAPRLDKLKTLLSQRPYTEELDEEQMIEEDVRGEEKLYSWDDLVSHVQASNGQLKEALLSLQAVEIGKYWRMVDEKFMQGLLEVILLSAVQHDWDLKLLQESEVVQTVKVDGFSPTIIRHCLACYGKEIELDGQEPGVQQWELEEKKVCLHYAKQLLQAATRWRLVDFMDAWRNNIPTGLQPTLEMLRGEALIELVGPDSWLRPYSVSSLPTKPADRFSVLFREKAKWEWEDLEPYLRGMQAPGQSVEAMLLKYTRKSQGSSNSPAIYTAR